MTSRWLTLNHSLWGFMKAEVGAFQGEKRAVHTPYPTSPSTYLGTWGRTHCLWFWCRKGRPGSRVKREQGIHLAQRWVWGPHPGRFEVQGPPASRHNCPWPSSVWPTPLRSVAHGLSSCSSRLQSTGSVVLVHPLGCLVARGILPDQGSNLCPLHWQVDS